MQKGTKTPSDDLPKIDITGTGIDAIKDTCGDEEELDDFFGELERIRRSKLN